MIYFIEDDRSINEAVFYSLKNSGFEVKGFERPSECATADSLKAFRKTYRR